MLIKVENPNKIVTSAHMARNQFGLSIWINTMDRWVYPDTTALWASIPEGPDSRATPEKLIFEYYAREDSNKPSDKVIIIAATDSEDEERAIQGFRFTLMEKDQLHIFIPNEEVIRYEN